MAACARCRAEDVAKLIDRVVARGMKPALAVKPHTPIEAVFPFADKLHMVLIMTVEPGFGGQAFMPDMMPKVRPSSDRRYVSGVSHAALVPCAQVQALRERFPHLHIEVDGGLGPSNIAVAAAAGANVIVAGTSVFKAADPAAAIAELRSAVNARMA